MKTKSYLTVAIITLLLPFIFSCKNNQTTFDFNNIHNRIWIGKDFWSVPIEDWKLEDGRIECTGDRPNMRVNLLTRSLKGEGNLNLSVNMGIAEHGDKEGRAGFRIGLRDKTDNNYKSLCYFGDGMEAGVSTNGLLFLDEQSTGLPGGFNFQDFTLRVNVREGSEGHNLTLHVSDNNGRNAMIEKGKIDSIKGLVSLVNNFGKQGDFSNTPRFWFDNLSIGGSMVEEENDHAFGPILWSMYTLSEGVMKMTAQMPPLGQEDNKMVQLQIEKEGEWETISEEKIDPDARIAVFRVEDWNAGEDHDYRLAYNQEMKDGSVQTDYYRGTIREDPKNQPLEVAGMTCQYHYGFPYRPLVENLEKKNPDLLYFSGDQIYEANGGYGIIRFPAERAILNYLGKWYMFGWAFGDLMRNRPTICIPDDHEVYQGNIWGAGGKNLTQEEWDQGIRSGFIEPPEMVNVVINTNCAHLPDPYNPEPMKQDIDVYYTELVYGRVSFGIVGDRIFKTGPEKVAFWDGRPDHLKMELEDIDRIDGPELKLLGDRQMKFLKHWVRDWKGADMKTLLSQTIFGSIPTHHGGNKMLLHGDLDSGGWPPSARDELVSTMRKAFAFHINGDQHMPMQVQYGTENFSDAGWAFCTPAIAVGYQRRFQPDKLGWPVRNRPEHGLANTGYYRDAFGHPHYVYAVGNPVEKAFDSDRYIQAQKRASGFGYITYNKEERTIRSEAIRFLADVENMSEEDYFPGWPHTVSQFDNYGRDAEAWLPTLNISGMEDPVLRVTDESGGELVYMVRINGKTFDPKVFSRGTYTVKVGDPDTDQWKELKSLSTIGNKGGREITIEF